MIANENEARLYWAKKMEEALQFQETMRTYPLEDCGEPLVSLIGASEGLEVEFSRTMINNCHHRFFFARQGLIASFQAVARTLNELGWILKVEDGYRSPEMQRALSHNPEYFDAILRNVIWELEGAVPDPAFMLRRMSALIATRCRVGTHVSGSAIDISVLDRATREEVPRGGSYPEFSKRTPMDSPFITPEEDQNRRKITAVFNSYGWEEYPWEFWHYSQGDSYAEYLKNSGRPAKYGPVNFNGNSMSQIDHAEADALLEPISFYEAQIEAALGRL